MASTRIWTALFALLALCSVVPVRAQEDEVQQMLQQLRETPAARRSVVRAQIVREHGPSAYPAALQELRDMDTTADSNYIGQVIVMVGQVVQRGRRRMVTAEQHQAATEALLNRVESANIAIAFLAIDSLETMWTTENAPKSAQQLKDLNGALLARVYGQSPAPITRQAVAALVRINNIMPDMRSNAMPLHSTEELIENTSQWFQQNPGKLPLLVKRPWELHLQTLITSPDRNARLGAFERLRNQRPFEAVDRILALLADPEELDEGVRGRLAELLELIAGIEYPPETDEDQTPVQAWRELWFQKLREESLTEAKLNEAIEYTWESLERTLYNYNSSPSQAAADRIKKFRVVLMHRLNRPEQIPATATAGARRLVEPPLESKAKLAAALDEFRERTQQRDAPLAEASAQLQRDWGPHIGVEYLQEILNLAFAEQDEIIAFELGGLLRTITRVPVTLSMEEIRERRDALEQWVEKVTERGYDVSLPEE